VVEEHDGDVRFFTGSGNTAISRMPMKNMQYNPYLWLNCQNFRVFRESGSRNTMVTSDILPEVEIWLFCACAMKSMQYHPYLWLNCQNFRVFLEIGVEEHDGDVSFSPEVEIQPFCACSVHPDVIIGTVRSLWTWLWGRYHVAQNAFLVIIMDC